MARIFLVHGDRLISKYDKEILWIEAWGKNSLRVRATHEGSMPENDWALSPKTKIGGNNIEIKILDNRGIIKTVIYML